MKINRSFGGCRAPKRMTRRTEDSENISGRRQTQPPLLNLLAGSIANFPQPLERRGQVRQTRFSDTRTARPLSLNHLPEPDQRPPEKIRIGGFPGKNFPGFSLIETIFAMTIVFFLLSGAAQMLCYSFLLKHKAELQRISTDLISNKLETLKSLGPEHKDLTPGIHQESIADKNSGRYFLLTWEVTEVRAGLKKVYLSLYSRPFGNRPPLRAVWFRSDWIGF